MFLPAHASLGLLSPLVRHASATCDMLMPPWAILLEQAAAAPSLGLDATGFEGSSSSSSNCYSSRRSVQAGCNPVCWRGRLQSVCLHVRMYVSSLLLLCGRCAPRGGRWQCIWAVGTPISGASTGERLCLRGCGRSHAAGEMNKCVVLVQQFYCVCELD